MKIRNGFVSNSSSSSFIVLRHNNNLKDFFPSSAFKVSNCPWHETGSLCIEVPTKEAKYRFDWEFERTQDILGKLNYLAIQIFHMKDTPLREDLKEKHKFSTSFEFLKGCLEKAIRKQSITQEFLKDRNLYIRWDYNFLIYDSISSLAGEAHIDHQSCTYELGWDFSLFKGTEEQIIEDMRTFLFNPESYVQGGNDNSDEIAPYVESMGRVLGKVASYHAYLFRKEPWIEGQCRDCGSDVEVTTPYIEYKDMLETPEHKVTWENLWNRVMVDYGEYEDESKISKEDRESFWRKYEYIYRCTNPKCKHHHGVITSRERITQKDVPFIKWKEEFNEEDY